MSLKRNIFANYASQLYVTLIGIVLVPLYVQYMGAEAYGLVGFFAMLQAWFNLLDLGLSPTIARESARYHGGAVSALDYRRMFRAISTIFCAIASLGGGGLLLLSDAVASHWLKIETLARPDVVLAVQIMAVSVALRWMCGLYRGVVTGAERLVWLSAFTAMIATLRFVGVLASMWLWGYTPRIFFIHQLFVAVFEVGGLLMMSRVLLPRTRELNQSIGWSLRPVKPMMKFALTITFTSSVWILVTQTDKLVLSGILPLTEYGYFTLAVLVASGIMVICGPISSAIMPRMARLHAEGQHDELIKVYRRATQWVSVTAGSAAATLAICAEPLLLAWSGNVELSINAAPILKLYAIGNGLLAITAFPYYLQYARGDLRYHLIGNAVIMFLLVPTIVYAASKFGGIGAGWVWLGINGLCLLTWVAYVHHKLEPGLHWNWLRDDVGIILLPMATAAMLAMFINVRLTSRIEMLMYTSVIGVLFLTVAVMFNRSLINQFFKRG